MSRRDLASRYWKAYEASLASPPGSAARNLERLQQRIEAGDEVDLDARPVASRRAAAGLLWWGKATAASVGLGVTTVLSVKLTLMGWAALTREAPPEPAPVVQPESSGATTPAVDSTPGPQTSATPPSLTPEIPSPSTQSPEPPPPSPPRRAAPKTTADALRAELALMDRARAALDRDDASTLWTLLAEHERRFPAGVLTEERQAWQAVAACALGRSDGPQRAARFLRGHAGSAQAPRVRQACVPTRTIE